MKVSRSLEAYWQRQHAFELKLQKENERCQLHTKQDKKHELETTLYERHVQKVRLAEVAAKGKNIDSYS